MLTIKNIDSLKDRYIGHWKIHYVTKSKDNYLIKVVHNGSPFDMFNLMIDRQRTAHGDYHVSCFETGNEQYIPIEVIRDRDEFVSFLIHNLT